MANSTERLKEYQFVRKIGKGSFGEVSLVRKKRDKKQFVMKNIRLSSSNVKERCAATQEAELLSQLKHPNIVSYHESFHDEEGILHIVMGYCEGGDLCTRLKSRNRQLLDEDKVVEWFVQIALALQYLHDKRIMHRDLKTQNIFLSKHDVIKVGDLGIARVLEGSLDLAHTVVGTPYYMSPELFANKPYDFKSDVWALGCCVYEIATLDHAFTAKNISALMYKILQGKVPPLPSCFTSELNELVYKMLSLDAKERPSVHQILRTEFVRFHIKQFLDKASARQRKSSKASVTTPTSPTANPSPSTEQKKVPPSAAVPDTSNKAHLLKPLHINEQYKCSPELSSAREKRRRSKQEAAAATKGGGRVILKSHRSTVSVSPTGCNDGQERERGGRRGDGSDPKEPVDEQDGVTGKQEDEDAVLSIMDTTLHLPDKPKPHPPFTGVNDDKTAIDNTDNPQKDALRKYCVGALGEELVCKALTLLDTSEDDDDDVEDKMVALLGKEKCCEFLALLQKLRLYSKTRSFSVPIKL